MVGDRLTTSTARRPRPPARSASRWGSAEAGELEDAGAAAIVDTPSDLADLLGSEHRGAGRPEVAA